MLISLIQPRAPYGLHPYLPNGILNLAARLHAVGNSVEITDFNIDEPIDQAFVDGMKGVHVIGVGVLGTPYIPEALSVVRKIRAKGVTQRVVVGGQGAMRLTHEQFNRIFAGLGDVVLATNDTEIADAFGVPTLPSMFNAQTDLAMATLPEHYAQAYLSQEWCLFTSDGCVYSCGFYAASKGQREQFRPTRAVEKEVAVLTTMTLNIGKTFADVYLSSLDITQNPEQMEGVLAAASSVATTYGVQLRMRGLATAKTLVRAVRNDPDILNRWREYGVHTIGLGVDGYDPDVWRRENKRHNSQHDVDDALNAIGNAGMTPEALMVIGFREDTPKAMLKASLACFVYTARGVTARPYLGKKPAPGSDAWAENGEDVERFLANPRLFRQLDYGAVASPATHPNRRQRYVVNTAYLATVAGLKLTERGCPTVPLLAAEEGSLPWRVAARLVNSVLPRDK